VKRTRDEAEDETAAEEKSTPDVSSKSKRRKKNRTKYARSSSEQTPSLVEDNKTSIHSTEQSKTKKNKRPRARTPKPNPTLSESGNWPHLRSCQTFKSWPLHEQSEHLNSFMTGAEQYMDVIGAQALPKQKMERFFRRIRDHLGEMTKVLDDVYLRNERSEELNGNAVAQLMRASVEHDDVRDMLSKFWLPSQVAKNWREGN
jgi:hypothetical protein